MKHENGQHKQPKSFLRIPAYPGGKKAFLEFIETNLIYPPEALARNIEGLVHLTYSVDNLGHVSDITITKSLGAGCDEEAIRLISLLKYEAVRNRGIKMKVQMKTRIHFRLLNAIKPVESQNITLSYSSPETKRPEDNSRPSVYEYTLKFD